MTCEIEKSKLGPLKLFIFRNLSRVVPNIGYDKAKQKKVKITWPLEIEKNKVRLPIGFCCENKELHELTESFSIATKKPTLILRKEQELFLNRVLISNPTKPFAQAWELKPAFGKTITSLAAIEFYNLPTIVIVHRRDLKKQWEQEIERQLPNLKIKVVMVSELQKISSTGSTDLVVVDEAHACITEKSAPLLAKLHPKILIGLSGTFYRNDNFDVYLEWLFGKKLKLTREESNVVQSSVTRTVSVKVIRTGIIPDIQQTAAGRLDWSALLLSLASNSKRNEIISEIIRQNSGLNILVLVKFVEHGNLICSLIKDLPKVETYFGNQKMSPEIENANVLISTAQKMGTGISLNRLNCLILAADFLNYSIQYISRVLRDKQQDALIFDLVDDFSCLEKHFKSRCSVYAEIGASILK